MRVLLPRWPGDAYLFARRFRDLLGGQEPRMVTAAEGYPEAPFGAG